MNEAALTPGWVLFRCLDCVHPIRRPRALFLGETNEVAIAAEEAADPVPGMERPDRAAAGPEDGPAVLRLVRSGDRWSFVRQAPDVHLGGQTVASGSVGAGDLLGWNQQLFCLRRAQGASAIRELWEEDGALEGGRPRLATLNSSLARQLDTLRRVSRSTVPVLISGETGTGKELVARAVHRQSGRPGKFVAVNCGAVPESLIHSLFFGHRKGAFSGASEAQVGFIRESDGGTLFLDEVSELPLGVQAVLLRVLQELEVCPVGSSTAVGVDLRIVSASNQDLSQLCATGRFRPDLYARLLGFCVELPPLRERPEDIGLIVAGLLRRLAPNCERVRLTTEAALALASYSWPLNVRELERCLATALVLAEDGPVELEHLPRSIRCPRPAPEPPGDPGATGAWTTRRPAAARDRSLTLDEERRREELVSLLQTFNGNVTAVSLALGKARMQVHRWIKRYDIDHRSFRASRASR